MMVKVIVADDHRMMREGLRALIEKQKGIEIVGEATNGREALDLVRDLSPDIAIVDVVMPDLNGIETVRKIHKQSPEVKVIVLSMYSDKRFVRKSMEGGALGYLLKDDAFDELTHAIRAVSSGKTFLSPGVADTVVRESLGRSQGPRKSAARALSPREREVLQLLAEGKRTKQIATILNVSVKTAEAHRQHLMRKLGIQSVASLTKYAIREGITPLSK